MKTEKELNDAILDITENITQNFPELIKYINEIPIKMSYTNSDKINLKHLEDHYNSLESILKKYSNNHAGLKK